MKYIKDQYWLLILSIVLLGINITYPSDLQATRINSNTYYSILFTVWLVLLYLGIKRKKIETILKIDWFAGFVFTSLFCSTFIANNGQGMAYLKGGLNCSLTFFSYLSWLVVFTLTFSFIRNNFGRIRRAEGNVPRAFYIWLALVLVWIVSIIAFLPGQISWDGLRQFCEFDRTYYPSLKFTYVPTNHHPWFTTLLFGIIFDTGRKIWGVNFGIFLIVLVQLVISSIIYASVIKYVWKRIGKKGGIATFVLFASPIFSSYIMTIDKSTLYYAFLAWFYLEFTKLFEIFENRNEMEWSYKELCTYCVSAIMLSLSRNDAFLIVLISTIILILLTLKKKKQLILAICSLIVILAVHAGWNSVLKKNNVIKSSPSEALTLPIRQLSYIYINDRSSFDGSDLKIINNITALSQIKSKYNINNGDYLKSLYPSDTFLNSAGLINDLVTHKKTLNTTKKQKKETVKYLELWLKEGIKHPAEYTNVYLAANSRYLNPFILYDSALFINYYIHVPFYMKPSWYNQYHPLFSENIRNSCRNILLLFVMFPPLAIINNPGTIVWIVLTLLFLLLKSKRKQDILFILPTLIMCLLFTVTSINGYTRYTIGVLAILPIIISFIWKNINEVKYIRKKDEI